MEKTIYQFEDFLSSVMEDYREFATKLHNELLQGGFKPKVELKKSGFFVSYSHSKTKRSILNLLLRKKGLKVRIYADNHDKYADFIGCLPESMENEIAKASVCRRLVNPEDCNPRCVMGYDFLIRGDRYQKCRYSCFEFEVNPHSILVISDFVNSEMKERLTA